VSPGLDSDIAARLRTLPSVTALADHPSLAAEQARYGRESVVDAARQVIADVRVQLKAGTERTADAAAVKAELARRDRPRLHRVINATGVILHTNLGRAPLAAAAQDAVGAVAGYCNLELRLDTGTRGGRNDGVDEHLRALTGAERAFAVNNGAAAALLSLAAVASGREVVVSRGELVEIGGGFRVPDVLAQSGCRLVEVGTTNRTRWDDYERALSPQTGAILKVHQSNFRISGFTEEVEIPELALLAQAARVPLIYDQGTGDLAVLRAAITAGTDLITSSGDKLLGGPQAGLLLGRREAVDRARQHPLARALRIDKLALAGLEATLALWRSDRRGEIPTVAMLAEPPASVRARAEELGGLLGPSIPWSVVTAVGAAGGGTRPDEPVPSWALTVSIDRAHVLAGLLRRGEPAVLARVADGALVLDLRTVARRDLSELGQAFRRAWEQLPGATEAAAGATMPEGDEEPPVA